MTPIHLIQTVFAQWNFNAIKTEPLTNWLNVGDTLWDCVIDSVCYLWSMFEINVMVLYCIVLCCIVLCHVVLYCKTNIGVWF